MIFLSYFFNMAQNIDQNLFFVCGYLIIPAQFFEETAIFPLDFFCFDGECIESVDQFEENDNFTKPFNS